MSHFGAGQFDDADGTIERRIQEELRARQQASTAAASRLTGALAGRGGFGGAAAAADRAFMSSLIAESAAATSASSPYYAQGAAHSPFARSPYSALGQQTSSAYGASDAVAASLYARQRAQYGYGNTAAAAATAADRAAYAYGVPNSGHDLYAQHFQRSQDQMTLIDRAAAYNAQQRQAEQANAALLTSPQPGSPSPGMQYIQQGTPNSASPKSTPRQPPQVTSMPTSASPNRGRPRKPMTPLRPNSAEKHPETPRAIKEGELISIPGQPDQKWYSGCVPLGIEDDKYWLSELQVYLRSDFAEAFGATEEDIAAPMHGRNKPIALGQVGIRCMHCKREYKYQTTTTLLSYIRF